MGIKGSDLFPGFLEGAFLLEQFWLRTSNFFDLLSGLFSRFSVGLFRKLLSHLSLYQACDLFGMGCLPHLAAQRSGRYYHGHERRSRGGIRGEECSPQNDAAERSVLP